MTSEKHPMIEAVEDVTQRLDALCDQIEAAQNWIVDATNESQRIKRILFEINLKLPYQLKEKNNGA